jgi:hypothetical protein
MQPLALAAVNFFILWKHEKEISFLSFLGYQTPVLDLLLV